jgi:hypothetical protein
MANRIDSFTIGIAGSYGHVVKYALPSYLVVMKLFHCYQND